MKPRLIASAALGVAVLLGATGCAFITPQATTIVYSPADGVNIPDSGPLKVRNVLIVSEGDGEAGNMIAAIVNETDEPHTLNIELGEGASVEKATVRVPAKSSLSLGNPSDDTPPLELENIEGPAGSTVPVYFQSGDSEGVLYEVPVLDGALDYYNELLP
ncbi:MULTISPECIES: DNA modification methylase [Microbacterium]|uniref:DNA modification methylase n=1 Tax=Microbacterium wangchenii TaxID=2541726 RepID=A0ABX5SXL5_9MICO|nr:MULTISPECIES: DNA modification methylase [Microbacterium]MCK6067515.1 DNA modification methylase [Microbacterium sp. EYE_512]QBR89555.1 DNA modification methylase [Microbacterium wangchenii]TFV80897.1 DNA modification methylase [Microbacterium sp. dk485]TXK16847.1 DNA modification methylase [Microbacterium wangchenii]